MRMRTRRIFEKTSSASFYPCFFHASFCILYALRALLFACVVFSFRFQRYQNALLRCVFISEGIGSCFPRFALFAFATYRSLLRLDIIQVCLHVLCTSALYIDFGRLRLGAFRYHNSKVRDVEDQMFTSDMAHATDEHLILLLTQLCMCSFSMSSRKTFSADRQQDLFSSLGRMYALGHLDFENQSLVIKVISRSILVGVFSTIHVTCIVKSIL